MTPFQGNSRAMVSSQELCLRGGRLKHLKDEILVATDFGRNPKNNTFEFQGFQMMDTFDIVLQFYTIFVVSKAERSLLLESAMKQKVLEPYTVPQVDSIS